MAQASLAEESPQGRCDLLARAIACNKASLAVRTPDAFPDDHAITREILDIDREAYEAAGCSPPFDEIPPAE